MNNSGEWHTRASENKRIRFGSESSKASRGVIGENPKQRTAEGEDQPDDSDILSNDNNKDETEAFQTAGYVR